MTSGIKWVDCCRYNSVIFSTTSAVDYDAWLVTSDFLTTSSAQNRTSTSSGTTISDDDRVRNLINNNGNFTRLDTADCISVYNQNFVSDNALGRFETLWPFSVLNGI